MGKYFVNKHFIIFALLLFLLVCTGLLFQFSHPTDSKADVSYSSLNCPTPEPGKSVLQLVPCTPSGAISAPVYQSASGAPNTSTAPSTSAPSAAVSSSPQSGNVCTPDSSIANGSSCNCQSDLEPDAVCTVSSAATCTSNGGISGGDLLVIGSGLGGAVNSNLTGGQSSNGSVQCLWLDSAPVPAAANATSCSIECNSKPVLYFYSPTSLSINVSLDIPGHVTASIPHYPAKGWQNVIVHPDGTTDGTLSYNNKIYSELYYEDATVKAQPPTQGFVIATKDLNSSLRTYTSELGLTINEQNEFLSYWVPRLTSLNAPYIFFTVFDQTQKEKVDHVVVSPAPETTIAFLAYFKPLSAPITVQPLQFPTVPQRNGFTMVEWGGTVDESK